MKRIVQLGTLAIALIFGLGFWIGATRATNRANVRANAESESSPLVQNNAKALYDKTCATCHGKDGRASSVRGKLTKAQKFTDASWQNSTSDEDMIETIENGRGKMPAYKNKLTAEQIKSLASYIRKFKK